MKTDFFLYKYYGFSRLRAIFYRLLTGIRFRTAGKNLKIFGARVMKIGEGLSLGDGCWLHAVTSYKGIRYTPSLLIGNDVSFSDAVHVSCIKEIRIGSGTLVGSGVYIGDHSHGATKLTPADMRVSPALRPLSEAAPIWIGDNVWIGDGARILAGSVIPDGSIVGANSVVKAKFTEPGVIAGVPASMKKRF